LDDPKTGALSIEVLSSGKKRWLYRRRIAGRHEVVKLSLGLYPAYSIADAREWANRLNLQLDAGLDPRETAREELRLATMTVDRAHELYMEAVREGRSSRAKRRNKPRTIADKQDIYRRDIAPRLGRKIIYDVTEVDLIKLVEAKGKKAKVRANRLAAELKVFFGWTASLRGLEVGLEVDPARRLGDLRFPEAPRTRRLALQEIEWFLQALVEEERDYQRGMLLWLLTAARLAEVCEARSEEILDGVWTIPGFRTKNSVEHRIALGPWGRSLMQSDTEWVFPAPKLDGPRSRNCWYQARNRVRRKMEQIAGRPVERFTPHDFRRTCRSNTKRLKVDFETAEAMLNHVKKGLERTYDTYELEDEKQAWFLRWETEIAGIARKAGVAEALGVPGSCASCTATPGERHQPSSSAPVA
jgi:integrase